MKILIDTDKKTLHLEPDGRASFRDEEINAIDLYSKQAFEILSRYWLKVGWNLKYSYSFTWLGCPIIQLPEDILRMQEIIFKLQPDVIVETGIAHGGSIIFYASLCHAMGKGRVIGVDREIRLHNRKRIESHDLKAYLSLIEGDSIDKEVLKRVRSQIAPQEKVMVILDSNHTYEHVSSELEAYADIVTPGSYIIVADGVMNDLYDVPRGFPHWEANNPAQAAVDFLKRRLDFKLEKPTWLFNESELNENITYCPLGWLKKLEA